VEALSLQLVRSGERALGAEERALAAEERLREGSQKQQRALAAAQTALAEQRGGAEAAQAALEARLEAQAEAAQQQLVMEQIAQGRAASLDKVSAPRASEGATSRGLAPPVVCDVGAAVVCPGGVPSSAELSVHAVCRRCVPPCGCCHASTRWRPAPRRRRRRRRG
jgi:hypothetical protein